MNVSWRSWRYCAGRALVGGAASGLAAGLGACVRYEPIPPGAPARVDSVAVVRAALSGGRSVVLAQPALAGDSLVGERLDAPGRARYAVALAEVERLEVQRFDPQRTGRAAWTTLGVTALLTLAFALVWAWLIAATEAT